MRAEDIICGVHYDALHELDTYRKLTTRPHRVTDEICKNSSIKSKRTVSLPFHEELSDKDVDTVIKYVKRFSS